VIDVHSLTSNMTLLAFGGGCGSFLLTVAKVDEGKRSAVLIVFEQGRVLWASPLWGGGTDTYGVR